MEAEAVFALRHGGDIAAQGADAAARRTHDAVEQLEERRLAAAVGPQQGHSLAGPDRQVDIIKGDLPPGVCVRHVSKNEYGLARTYGSGLNGPWGCGRGHGSHLPDKTATNAIPATPAIAARSAARRL